MHYGPSIKVRAQVGEKRGSVQKRTGACRGGGGGGGGGESKKGGGGGGGGGGGVMEREYVRIFLLFFSL